MIRINEIFTSVDGEVNRFGQGHLTTFIRFQGCNLRCSYCDTKWAQDQNNITKFELMTVDEICAKVETDKVTITGGEPLWQRESCVALIKGLMERGKKVTIETNGSIKIPFDFKLSTRAHLIGWVIDYKIEQAERMQMHNFMNAGPGDFIKFVLDSESDYLYAVDFIDSVKFDAKLAFGFTSNIDPQWLINSMISDRLDNVLLNCQIHKFIDVR